MSKIDCEYVNEITCPYCGWQDRDSWEMNDDYDEEFTCGECDEIFAVSRHIEVTYSSSCLKHDWGKVQTFEEGKYKGHQFQYCKRCNDFKSLTHDKDK